jgi:hypothetical protein
VGGPGTGQARAETTAGPCSKCSGILAGCARAQAPRAGRARPGPTRRSRLKYRHGTSPALPWDLAGSAEGALAGTVVSCSRAPPWVSARRGILHVPPWSPLIGHLVLTSTLAAGPRDDLDARRGSSRVVVGMPAQQWEPARAPPRERLHCCGSLLAHAAEEVRTRRHGYRSPPTSRWLVGRCSRTPPREPGPTAMAAVRRYTGNKGIDAAASPARPRWKLVVRCPPRAPRRLAGCAGRAGRTRGAGHIGRTHEGGCGADCARTRSRSRPRKPHTVERMSAAVRGGSPETIQQIGPASPMALSFFLFLFLFF